MISLVLIAPSMLYGFSPNSLNKCRVGEKLLLGFMFVFCAIERSKIHMQAHACMLRVGLVVTQPKLMKLNELRVCL